MRDWPISNPAWGKEAFEVLWLLCSQVFATPGTYDVCCIQSNCQSGINYIPIFLQIKLLWTKYSCCFVWFGLGISSIIPSAPKCSTSTGSACDPGDHISQKDLVREELGNSFMIHVICYKRQGNHTVWNELPFSTVGWVVARETEGFYRVLWFKSRRFSIFKSPFIF